MEAWRKELYLAHHGIKGQKWGVRRGPPYPLGAHPKGTKSLRKSFGRLDNRVEKSYNASKKLSKASVTAYGAGQFDHARSLGERTVKETLKSFGSYSAGSFGDIKPPFRANPQTDTNISDKARRIAAKTGLKLKAATTSLTEDCYAANSDYDKNNPAFENNCGHACIAYLLRRMGLDVKAKPMEGEQIVNGMTSRDVGRYFKALIPENITLKNASSRYEYREALSKELLDLCDSESGAFGMISLMPADNRMGHYIAWENDNGYVVFSNPQNAEISAELFFELMARGTLRNTVQALRLDDLDVKTEFLNEVVRNV